MRQSRSTTSTAGAGGVAVAARRSRSPSPGPGTSVLYRCHDRRPGTRRPRPHLFPRRPGRAPPHGALQRVLPRAGGPRGGPRRLRGLRLPRGQAAPRLAPRRHPAGRAAVPDRGPARPPPAAWRRDRDRVCRRPRPGRRGHLPRHRRGPAPGRQPEEAAPAAARDLQRSERFGEFARQAQLEDKVQTFVDELPDRLRGGDTVDALRAAASRGAAFVATFVLMVFVLISGPRFIDSGLAQIRDPERREGIRGVLAGAYPRAWRYVALSLAKAVVAGLFTWFVCVTADVPGAILLGLWVGAWSLVPAVGVLVGSLAVVLLAVPISLETAGALLALFLGYQVAEVFVVQRRIEHRSIHVGPFVSLVVAALGLELYGVGGLFGGLALVVFALCVLDGLAPSDSSDLPDAAREALDAP
ncbi:MAG TPA: AI-2E family transporter [Acidimicrobiales bacterium]|nr:AI-2E family transporter [Acidimicrobiales bacterium]